MRRTPTFIALLSAAIGTSIVLATSAFAHVTVNAPGATRGGSDQEITFRVPVEKNVATVGLEVALPTDTPIASVLVEPVPGWTHTETIAKLAKPIVTDDGKITTAVSRITWKAQPGHGLEPGEFGSFTIIAGQLPDTSSLTLPALQTYADGSVVRWIEVAAPGSKAEPEDPAPVLDLAASSSDQASKSASSAPARSGSSNALSVTLSVVALVIAVGAAALAFLSRRSTAAR